jgi:hypothetical protein
MKRCKPNQIGQLAPTMGPPMAAVAPDLMDVHLCSVNNMESV